MKLKEGIIAGLSTIALGVGIFVGVNLYRPSLYLAQKFEFLRNRYTEGVVDEEVGELPKYVSSIGYVYQEGAEAFRKKHALTDRALMFTYGGKRFVEDIGDEKIISEIYVLPRSFENEEIKNDDDFRNFLIDHEWKHAEYYFHGFPSIRNFEWGRRDIQPC